MGSKFYIPLSVAYLVYLSSNLEEKPRHDLYFMQDPVVDLYRYEATSEERNFRKRAKALNSLETVFAMLEHQSNLEEKDNSIHFHINTTTVI